VAAAAGVVADLLLLPLRAKAVLAAAAGLVPLDISWLLN
jgi:hypothetical protein